MTRRWHHLRAQARLAWHVFRGRPLAYRVTIHGGIATNDVLISECTFGPGPESTTVSVHAELGKLDPGAVARALKQATKTGHLRRGDFR